MTALVIKKCGVIAAIGLLSCGAAKAANTSFEKISPSQSSTVFVPSGSEQYLGSPPARAAVFSLHETPALWLVTDPSERVTMLPDLDVQSLGGDEVMDPAPKVKIKKPKAKHKVKQRIRKKRVVACAPAQK